MDYDQSPRPQQASTNGSNRGGGRQPSAPSGGNDSYVIEPDDDLPF